MGKDTKILTTISLTAFVVAVLFVVFITNATKKEKRYNHLQISNREKYPMK